MPRRIGRVRPTQRDGRAPYWRLAPLVETDLDDAALAKVVEALPAVIVDVGAGAVEGLSAGTGMSAVAERAEVAFCLLTALRIA